MLRRKTLPRLLDAIWLRLHGVELRCESISDERLADPLDSESLFALKVSRKLDFEVVELSDQRDKCQTPRRDWK